MMFRNISRIQESIRWCSTLVVCVDPHQGPFLVRAHLTSGKNTEGLIEVGIHDHQLGLNPQTTFRGQNIVPDSMAAEWDQLDHHRLRTTEGEVFTGFHHQIEGEEMRGWVLEGIL